ncbi:hypothetical protein UFOVP1266_6 [uncultured Caudovirales phage]|uniref:Uncharacterized protein n=1 Tax=uncultured Caudovirales phage TaxID=2100421 RepID=A0A6J5PL94_9CAUD|nr:hypothetical protein UFOVP876_6 [uncultured Caudovirales phage]CAB4194861.1 hypothetical protein UFOVP1266_6 [uncultured Caudovirales phage]
MTALITALAVALIGGPVMWLLARFDRRNTKQHGQSIDILERLDGKVDRLDAKVDRLDEKIDNHNNDNRRHR